MKYSFSVSRLQRVPDIDLSGSEIAPPKELDRLWALERLTDAQGQVWQGAALTALGCAIRRANRFETEEPDTDPDLAAAAQGIRAALQRTGRGLARGDLNRLETLWDASRHAAQSPAWDRSALRTALARLAETAASDFRRQALPEEAVQALEGVAEAAARMDGDAAPAVPPFPVPADMANALLRHCRQTGGVWARAWHLWPEGHAVTAATRLLTLALEAEWPPDEMAARLWPVFTGPARNSDEAGERGQPERGTRNFCDSRAIAALLSLCSEAVGGPLAPPGARVPDILFDRIDHILNQGFVIEPPALVDAARAVLPAAVAALNAGAGGLTHGHADALNVDFVREEGIEALRGCRILRSLWIREAHGIEDLDWVADLPALRSLEIERADWLTDVAGLTQRPELEVLALGADESDAVLDLSPIGALSGLTELTLPDAIAADIAFLRRTPWLRRLDLNAYLVADVTPIADLRRLEDLEIHHAEGADLGYLRALPMLRRLKVSPSEGADLRPLMGLAAVEELSVMSPGSGDLSIFRSLPRLHRLNICHVQAASLEALAGHPSLRALDISSAEHMVDLTPLATLQALEELDIGGTAVEDLRPLAALPKLRRLNLRNTPASDLSPLAACTELEELDIGATDIRDLAPLRGLTSLKTLSLHGMWTRLNRNPDTWEPRSLSFGDRGVPATDLSPLADLPNLQRVPLPGWRDVHWPDYRIVFRSAAT